MSDKTIKQILLSALLLIREMSLSYRLWLSVADGVKIHACMKKALVVHHLRNQNCLACLAGKKTGVAVYLARTNYVNILKREIHCIIPFLKMFGINDQF